MAARRRSPLFRPADIRRDFLSSPAGVGSKLMPSLATEWTRNRPKELVLKLRQGVTFHNGDAFTTDDVVFTFTSPRMFGDKPLLPEANVLLEHRLASWCGWIVSKRAYEALGTDGGGRVAGHGALSTGRILRHAQEHQVASLHVLFHGSAAG